MQFVAGCCCWTSEGLIIRKLTSMSNEVHFLLSRPLGQRDAASEPALVPTHSLSGFKHRSQDSCVIN
jgi:hypothetical protein